jgi:hypothetical protein
MMTELGVVRRKVGRAGSAAVEGLGHYGVATVRVGRADCATAPRGVARRQDPPG